MVFLKIVVAQMDSFSRRDPSGLLSTISLLPAPDVAPNPETPNLWELTFLNPDDTANVEKLSVANAEPVAQNILLTHNISTASLATTAWGFLGGLLGCLAVSKRRSEHLMD